MKPHEAGSRCERKFAEIFSGENGAMWTHGTHSHHQGKERTARLALVATKLEVGITNRLTRDGTRFSSLLAVWALAAGGGDLAACLAARAICPMDLPPCDSIDLTP